MSKYCSRAKRAERARRRRRGEQLRSKLRRALRALLACIVGIGCSPATPTPAPAKPVVTAGRVSRQTRVPPPAPPAPTDAGAAPADAADAGAAADETDAGTPTTTAPARAPHVAFEHPYKLYERPRAKGEVYAAGQDELLARWNVGGNGDPAFISNRAHYHPGARVIVRVDIPPHRLPKHAPYDRRKGRYRKVLSETAVLAQARARGYWPFRMCFEDGLRRDQHVHGKVFFNARIATSGHVIGARITKQKLPDDDVRKCLLERVGELAFSVGPPRAIRFGLSIELWPGDAPVPSKDPPPDAPDNPGELDGTAIERAALDARGAITACYATGLERDAALWGRVQLQIDLDETGRTRRVRETESHFPDRDVSACIVRAAKQIGFPAAKAGALTFVFAVRLGDLPSRDATTGNSVASPQ